MKNPEQKIKIAAYGAWHTSNMQSFEALEKAQFLGAKIAEHGLIALVPSAPGFPLWVAKGAKEKKGSVIGFSPASTENEHHMVYDLPFDHQDMIIYSGFGYAGSDLLLSRSSDAIVFGYGGLETVHEFWVAFQEGKPIGILKGDWDTDEILYSLFKDNKEMKHDHIIFDDDANRLIERLVKMVKNL